MSQAEGKNGTLSVTGEGQVKVKADTAWVQLGVLTEAKFAADAVRDNAEVATKVIEMVKTVGVTADQIRTTTLNVFPVYGAEEATRNVIISYRAENAIVVETPIELAGRVFDTGVSSGATESSNISFGLKDDSAARRQALQNAVKAARRDAEAVTQAMGASLRAAHTVEIESGGGPVFTRFERTAATNTPVVGGDITVSARVRFVFDYQLP